jgi:hypothetical protein
MPLPTTIEVVSTQQHGLGQTTYYEQTLRILEGLDAPPPVLATLRLTIRTDSYAEQAHAYVDVWSQASDRWERLHWIAGPTMATASDLGYTPAYRDSPDRCSFYESDRAELLRVAAAVLGFDLPEGDKA